MTQWEYMLVEQDSVHGKFLPDFYGRKGWELVAAVRATETIDRLWFKRRKKKPRTPHPSAGEKENDHG
jgi:hypothetical protein